MDRSEQNQLDGLLAKARGVLRGQVMEADEAFALSQQLIRRDAHYWARRFLTKLLERSDLPLSQRQRLSQALALATYKDPALLRDRAFEEALNVLAAAFDLTTTRDQETLGLLGSVYKRRWRVDGRREWLERSLHYYRRGYECGVAGDQGYTAVNAAFVQDVLADLEENPLQGESVSVESAHKRRADADAIRNSVIEAMEAPTLGLAGDKPDDYWPIATLAEVYFGMERYPEAAEQLTRASAVPGVADWMRKTTVEQLVRLTQVQLGTSDPEAVAGSAQWAALKQLVGDERAPAVLTMFSGKVGLALSGGGFRASLYHLGVLARLAELDLLRHVEVLSCVSGGSIVGAHYYLELRRLMQFSQAEGERVSAQSRPGRADHEITQQDYIDLVAKLIDDFLDGVQRNLRVRMLANPWTNIQMLFRPTYSRTQRLGELYEAHLYSRVEDGNIQRSECAPGGRWLRDLIILPPDEDSAFRPDKVNWRRCNKVPQLVLNATALNTGHVWQFTTTWMGESPNIIDRDVDKSPRLRRLYYYEAPEAYRCFRLGHAVAASSCVPGLFEPIELPALYKDLGDRTINVRLVDGGVYDNLGVASLAEQGCSVMIVSDASGQLTADDDPAGGMLGPLMRSTSVMMGRIRGAEYEDLQGRVRAGLLKGFAYVHLTQGLNARDLDWKGSEIPPELKLDEEAESHTPYGVRCDVQRRLAAMRTDLDSFSDLEAFALMNSGYRAMSLAAQRLEGFPVRRDCEADWAFRRLDDQMQSAHASGPDVSARDLDRHLGVADMKFFRVWRLSPWLFGAAIAVGLVLIALLAAWFAAAWRADPDMSLLTTAPARSLIEGAATQLTLRNLATGLAVLVGGYLAFALFGAYVGKRLRQFFRLRSVMQRAVIGIGIGVLGWILAGLHLWLFDRLFLRLGRLRRD